MAQTLFAGYADFDEQFKTNPKKQEQWEKMSKVIDNTADALGNPIDEKIKEVVIVLNLLGFKTTASCEGHLGWGYSYPWIEICVEEEGLKTLGERLNCIQEEIKKLSSQDDLSLEDGQRLKNLYGRVWNLRCSEEKYLLQQAFPVYQLLQTFYFNNPSIYGVQLVPNIRILGAVRIYNRDGEWQPLRTEEEKEAKLIAYQQEMNLFTNFLIEKFLESF